MARILVVDDDEHMVTMLIKHLQSYGHEVEHAGSLTAADMKISSALFDIVLLDVHLPDGSGLDFLSRINAADGAPEVIIITGMGDPDGAEMAIRSGAWDYVEKGASLSALTFPITRALQHRALKQAHDPVRSLKRNGIAGRSAVLDECLGTVYRAAQSDIGVLISGETGTGKELVAWAVHANSARSQNPFVVVDCAALPENLVESLLFGHVRGAFSGADKDRDGLIRQADGGTLFLDEVGELPLSLQKSFLRALQERRFRPVGSEKETTSDFRLVCATNRDLDQMEEAGFFRSDLLFRIRSFVIEVPPLRSRIDDVEILAHHFLDRLNSRLTTPTKSMSPEFVSYLVAHRWPGNVRELQSCIERSVASAGSAEVLEPNHLPKEVRISVLRAMIGTKSPECALSNQETAVREGGFPSIEKARLEADKRYLHDLMAFCQGDIQQACLQSGLSRSRLYVLLNQHEIPYSRSRQYR